MSKINLLAKKIINAVKENFIEIHEYRKIDSASFPLLSKKFGSPPESSGV